MDKKRALQLAYQIVGDKRNANRYGNTAILRKEDSNMFTYSDMLDGLRALFNDLDDARKTPALQKPITLAELEALIAAGEDVAVYCETKNDPHAYATILFAGQVISPNGDKINACDLVYFHYGKTWRAWAQRPTDEERAAASWEGTGNADL
jgi:hypothetical protein